MSQAQFRNSLPTWLLVSRVVPCPCPSSPAPASSFYPACPLSFLSARTPSSLTETTSRDQICKKKFQRAASILLLHWNYHRQCPFSASCASSRISHTITLIFQVVLRLDPRSAAEAAAAQRNEMIWPTQQSWS